MEVSKANILEFLQDDLEEGLAPNTLWRQVASLSSILSCGSGSSLSHLPLIRQFLRGATNLRPSVIYWFPIWDLTRVLNALTRGPFEPLREASLKFLSYKVAFLVAVTLAHRISELVALLVNCVSSIPTGSFYDWTLPSFRRLIPRSTDLRN